MLERRLNKTHVHRGQRSCIYICTEHHIIILLHKVTFLVNMPLTLLLKDSYEHFFLFHQQLNAIQRGSYMGAHVLLDLLNEL